MGLLSRFFGQQLSPFGALAPQAPMLGPSPLPADPAAPLSPMAALAANNKPAPADRQSMSTLSQAQQPQGFWNRLNQTLGAQPGQAGAEGLLNNPLLLTGLSLLGNAQNGGDWRAVGRDVMGITQAQQQRRLQERQMQRENKQDERQAQAFGWEAQNQTVRAQQVRDWRQAIAREQDPDRRMRLQATGPDGYARFLEQQDEMQWRATEAQLDRDFRAREGALDRGARAAEQNNVLGRYFQTRDAERLATENETAARMQTIGLPGLVNLRATIERAGELALPGQPIDARARVTLGRIFNGSSEDRATLEVWRAQVLTPALEVMRGLGAMSQREFEEALNAFANPNMTYGAATRLVNQRIAEAERRIAMATYTTDFFGEARGITGVRNPAGEDYATYTMRRLQEEGMMPSGSWEADRPAEPGRRETVGQLPDASTMQVGDRATNNGVTLVVTRAPNGVLVWTRENSVQRARRENQPLRNIGAGQR